jgi:hypothetical protein
MSLLSSLATKYGTDKAGCYAGLYDRLLRHQRYQVTNVLEIGIGTPALMSHVQDYRPGASLRMWEEYFPNARIVGWDNTPSVLFNEGRIQTRLVDQTCPPQMLQAVDCAFDLIVDDGSHKPEDQIRTALTLMPYVVPGGLYIIEDVNELQRVSKALPFEHVLWELSRTLLA